LLTDVVLSFGIFEGALEDRLMLARLRGAAARGGVRGWSLSLSLLVVAWLEALLSAMVDGCGWFVVLCVESVESGVVRWECWKWCEWFESGKIQVMM
jgi:hypothetical protein